jgi:GIY-YIG catalytic domain
MLNKYNINCSNKIMCITSLGLQINYNLNKRKLYSNIPKLNIIPIISYSNVKNNKFIRSKVLKENRKKTGIYRWTNIITGDSYIGSAIDLSKRLNNYLNIAFLNKELKKGRSVIYSALLKYGFSKFKLDILEYCQPIDLIKREQYYFDSLNPKYNILKTAGSSFGFKHSETTKEILRKKGIGRLHSKTTLNKISLNSHMSIPVIIKNIKSGVVTEFLSITKASKYMGILPYHFQYYLDKQPIKNKYLIIRINNENYTVKPKELVDFKIKGLIVTNNNTGVFTEFPSYVRAAEFVGTDSTYLSRSIAKKGFYKGHGFTVKKKE